MRRFQAACLWVPLAACLAGCGGGPRIVYVPIVDKPADAAWPFVIPATTPGPKEAPKEGKVVLVAARFIAGHPADLKKAGIDCDKPLSPLPSADSLKALDRLIRGRRAQLLAAPNLLAYPGQAASITLTSTYHYVADYAPKKPESPDASPWVPVLGKVHDGFVLTVRAELEGDQIALTTLDPKLANAVGMRECKSWISAAGKEVVLLNWQEPVFLTSEAALPANEKVMLKPGTSVAVPLAHTLRVTEGTVRKHLDHPVDAKNVGALQFLAKPDKLGYPLPGRIVLIVTARAMDATEAEAAMKRPAPKPPAPPRGK